MQPHELTLAEMSARLEARELTSVALVESVLARAAETEPAINAYVTVLRDRALEDAGKADDELAAGRRRGPLHGVPIAVKDMLHLAGEPTLAGSRSRPREPAVEDAHVVQRLRAAGAVISGKTTPHEHLFGVESPPARNPWDVERIPGGSSGGSAASVAVCSSAAAIGSDTGGSIRLPAAVCGVVGLKPTYGLVSACGTLPAAWTLDHLGPLARTVEDAALVLNVLADGGYTTKLGRDVYGMRVGVPRQTFWEWCDEPVESVVRSAIAVLEAEGAELVEVDIELVGYTLSAGFVIALVENATHHRRALRERAHLYGPEIRALLDTGALLFGVDYLDAQRVRTLVRREFRRVFDEHRLDVLATPSAPTVAPRVGEGMVSLRGGPEEPIVLALVRPLIPFDLTGQPAISVPCGLVDELPVGLQLAARPFDEATLLQAAQAYEAATDWSARRPPI